MGVRTVMSGHVWGKDSLVCLGPLFLQLRDPLAAQEFAALCVVLLELYAGWAELEQGDRKEGCGQRLMDHVCSRAD